MSNIRRREAVAAATAGALSTGKLLQAGTSSIGETLRLGMERRKIPCVTAMVADSRRILYQGAFGTRDAESGVAVKFDSIFSIASMTKAITSAAALQLVEQKKAALDEPAERHLPELRGRQVLDGFAVDGRARLRAPARPVTLRHLLTHTSGLCYALWDRTMQKWESRANADPSTPPPLIFDPGARWQYGQGIDLAGRLVENISGLSLEDYFQKHILAPLGMRDTSFLVPPEKFERLVTGYQRTPGGEWTPQQRQQPVPPRAFNGGGGLYSSAPDYVRFMQMILQRGGTGVLSRESIKLMSTNQTGELRAGILQTTDPAVSADMDVHPGASDRYTLGFLLNPEPHQGGRSAGSLAWAGLRNTFYWIDPARGRCAVLMMQYLPFVDAQAVGLLNEFERAVYS
jgi:methyl acetate hydrolase